MTNKNTYIKSQMNILSSLGLFYMIIITLFAVPLMGAFVIVIIQGVIDFKYAIIFGSALLLITAIFYLIKFFREASGKIRGDGSNVMQGVKSQLVNGTPVQVSIFNGLISFTYGKSISPGSDMNLLPSGSMNTHNSPRLISCANENQNHSMDVITRLKELSKLKKQGMINEDEFQVIKKNLIEDSSNANLSWLSE